MRAFLKELGIEVGKSCVVGLLLAGAMLAFGVEDEPWANLVAGYLAASVILSMKRRPQAAAPSEVPPESADGKREVLDRAARQGEIAVLVDTRVAGVDVPEALRGNTGLVLKLSHNYATGPLEITKAGVVQRLSFSGVGAYVVRIPWEGLHQVKGKQSLTIWELPVAEAPKPSHLRLVH